MDNARTGRTATWLVVAIALAAASLAAASAARELAAEEDEHRAVEAAKGLIGLGQEMVSRPRWIVWLMPWLPAERSAVVRAYMWGPLGDKEGAILERLPHLKRLTVPDEVTSGGFAHVSKLAELARLSLPGTNVTDDDLATLAPLRNLKTIVLCNTAITDRGLEALLKIPSLESVDIAKTQTTADGILKLRGLPRLKLLRLDNERKTPLPLAQRENFINASGQPVAVDAPPMPRFRRQAPAPSK